MSRPAIAKNQRKRSETTSYETAYLVLRSFHVSSSFRLTRRLVAFALAAVSAVACLSPTLPLPPPARPDIEGPNALGEVRLSGTVLPNSQVFALNNRTNLVAGEQTDGDGSYDFVINARVDDEISFWYARDTVSSPVLYFRIPDNESSSAAGGAGGAGGAAGE